VTLRDGVEWMLELVVAGRFDPRDANAQLTGEHPHIVGGC
jgi:hypothetical protein